MPVLNGKPLRLSDSLCDAEVNQAPTTELKPPLAHDSLGGAEVNQAPTTEGRPPLAHDSLGSAEVNNASTTEERAPLAQKALAEGYARLRYRDTSLLIWQQQQTELEGGPPATYLSRSQSAWYSSHGNQAVVVRDRKTLGDGVVPTEGSRSKICLIM